MKHLAELILNNKPIQFVLNYPGLVDPDVLRKAAKAVIESVDASAPMSVSSMMDLRRPPEEKARNAGVRHEL